MKFIIYLLLLLTIHCVKAVEQLYVDVHNADGTVTKKDLIEYIEEGRAKISNYCNSPIQKKAILLLGVTGTGKTTTVNYLNGVPLVSIKDPATRKWIIDIAPTATSLPCGFKIGHGTTSETIFPAVYSPPGKDFSYVDTPGFGDTRGFAIEIANNFFRSYVTEKASEFKFLLLVTQEDINLKGQIFRETIKRFTETLGIFSEPDVKTLSKSVAIIVTRVENDGDSDEVMKTFLREKLNKILIEEKSARKLSTNEELVFNQLIKDHQVEIFSNPKTNGPVSTTQATRINSMISSMSFFSKADAKFRVTIAPAYLSALNEYIQQHYDMFKNTVYTFFNQNITNYVKSGIENAFVVEDLQKIEALLNDLRSKGLQKVDFPSFIHNVNVAFLNKAAQEALIQKKQVIDFFIQLLPTDMQARFSSDKNYLNEFGLEMLLNNQINFVTKMYKQETSIANDVLTIKGCFFKSSDIAREVQKAAKVKAIAIYACQAVDFDVSLNLQDRDNLIIISPKWNVEKPLVIDLNGVQVPPGYSKASNGASSGAAGSNGFPGLPGKNGGNFYGFGLKYLNIDKLTYNLNGGQGGPGGNGGDGAASGDGSHCTIPATGYFVERIDCPGCSTRNTYYANYGSVPSNGGNGGLGGIGGLGGLAGRVIIQQADATKFTTIIDRTGHAGAVGNSGYGGSGALGGCRYKCTRSYYYREWRQCRFGIFGACISSYTARDERWNNDLVNSCYSRQNGVQPSSINEVGRQPNQVRADITKSILLEYKKEETQNGYSNAYPLFYKSIDMYLA